MRGRPTISSAGADRGWIGRGQMGGSLPGVTTVALFLSLNYLSQIKIVDFPEAMR